MVNKPVLFAVDDEPEVCERSSATCAGSTLADATVMAIGS
jgi:hypothetical protein